MSDFERSIKKLLREDIQRRKKDLPLETIKASDCAIVHNVLALPEYRQAKTLFCFVGRENEIDTRAIIEHALRCGKLVGIPRIVSSGVMEVHAIDGLDGLLLNQFGILEPAADTPLLPIGEIDFAIVPCLSCDRQGNRLGYGGGYYDRYLASTEFVTAAICRETLICDTVPTEPWDVRVDVLVTENGVMRTK